MAEYIEFNRNGCLLQGSISILKSINGVVPIIHSTAGCAIQEKYISNVSGGYSPDNYSLASTNVIEKQIIFGGTSRLREQIKNTVKVLEGDLYVVISGCATEIVGDDIGAMTKEAADQGYPVINISTPGFKGHSFDAYVKVTKSLIDEVSKAENEEIGIDPDLINVFGISPGIDAYWEGNLEEINSLLEQVGLKSNRLFGYKSSVQNWKRIRNAGLNIVFGEWGLEIGRYLKQKYGTRYVYLDSVKPGIKGIEELLDKLAEAYKNKKDLIDEIKLQKVEKYHYYLSKLIPYYFKNHIQKEVALIGPSHTIIPLGEYLEESFGQIITSLIITNNESEQQKDLVLKRFKNTDIDFLEDGRKIEKKIRYISPEIILGSQLEKNIANELNVPVIYISLPIEEQIVSSKRIFGVDGTLAFLEDYSNFFIK